MCSQQEAVVGGFVKDFAQRGAHNAHYSLKNYGGESPYIFVFYGTAKVGALIQTSYPNIL
jgi:hypothetical protein